MAKSKNPKIILTGVAEFPWLNKADTQFDPAGVFHTGIIMSAEDAQEHMKTVDAIYGPHVKAQKKVFEKKMAEKKASGKAKKGEEPVEFKTSKPYYETEDGNVVFNAKLKVEGRNSQGETWVNKLPIFTKGGAEYAGKIFGGSKIAVSAELIAFPWNPVAGAGVSLRMKAVQVLEAAKGGGAKSYGFDVSDEDVPEDTDDEFEAADEDSGGNSGAGDEDDDEIPF